MATKKTTEEPAAEDPTTPEPEANTPAPESDPAPEASASGSGSDSSAGATSAAGTDTSALNSQIVQAVDKTNSVAIDSAGPEANGIAYQKVAQAAAFSVQDSTDYMRNVMTMAATAQGICLQLMIAKQTTDPYTDIITAAQQAVTAAQTNFAAVGTSAGTVVGGFPSS